MEQNLDGSSFARIVLDAIDGFERRRHLVVEILDVHFQLGLGGVRRAPQFGLQALFLLLHRLSLGLPLGLRLLARQHQIVRLHLREVRLQTVIIRLAERIELMIVASRAAHRHAQKRRAHDVGHLGEHLVVRTGHVLIAGVLAQRPQAVESAGDEVLPVGRVHLIARDLLLHESVVRLVVIEALDHIIAIAPGVRPVHIVLVSIGFGEAHHVQPVASPLLAVVGRGQQPVYHFLPCIGRFVGDERVDFLRGGRQSRQVEGDAADESGAVGSGRRFQAGFLQTGQNEGVHRSSHPGFTGGVGKHRRRRIFPGLKLPLAPLHGRVGSERRHGVLRGDQQRRQRQHGEDSLH